MFHTWTKRISLAVLVVMASLWAGACAPEPQTPATPAPVTIAMGYIPNVQFAPFYVAQEKGYFQEEGLNVAFNYGFDTDLIKLLATDELQFVVGSGDQVVLARSQGLPIVYVLQWYQQYPVSVVSLKEKDIHTPADLIGKVVGTPVMYGASYIGWKGLAYGADLSETEVSLQTIGYTQVASLLEERVDAAICYTANEPVQLRTAGHEINEIMVSDYVTLVSNGLITNEKSINERAEVVGALVRALRKGIQYTVDHPDEAFEITVKIVPEAGGENAAAQSAVLLRCVELWTSDHLGSSTVEQWTASQDFMRAVGLVDKPTDVNTMFTNRFVEEAAQ